VLQPDVVILEPPSGTAGLMNDSRDASPRAHAAALWRAPLLAFAIAFVATGGLAAYLVRSIEERNQAAFNSEVARAMEAIRERVAITTTLLRGASGLFAASDHVDRREFAAYVERLRLRQSYPGILGIGFTQRIDPDELDDVVREARAAGLVDFRVWPTDLRNEYHSIVYLEPFDRRNQAALGFDMYTEETRREAMATARDSGEIAASGPVLLVQEIDAEKQSGFLMYAPVYDAPGTPSDIEQRRRLLHGFVYSPLRIGDLIAGTLGQQLRPIELELFDASAASEHPMYSNRSPDDLREQRFVAEQTLYVAGRQWVARFGSRPEFEFISYWFVVPWLVLGVMAASLLLGGITYVQARAGRDARRAVARQRTAAEALHLEREWLRATLTSIGDAVIAVDSLDRIVLMNAVSERLTGWSQEEARGLPRAEVVRTGPEATESSRFAGAVSGELRLLSRDDVSVPVEHSTAPIRDPAGIEYGAVIVMRDVTERQRAELALRSSEEQARDRSERLHALATATPGLIGAESVETLVAAVESQARHLFAAPHARLLVEGQMPDDELEPADTSLEVRVIGREGDPPGRLCIAARTDRPYDEDDRVLLSQLAGIAAIALSNVQLTEELRAADRRKDEFLATLAHELRNPLAPICNSLEILRRHPGGEPAERARAVASRQAWHMVRLIDDLLDLSRISRGTIVLQRERMAIATAVEAALEASEPLIISRGHALEVAPLPHDLFVDGDATRLAQVFSNLLNNAANYTDPGGRIDVGVSVDDNTIRIAVRDTGMGIDPQHLPRVFDLFMQAERVSGREGGLGIGLTLVRRLVEMHGGRVEAHSAGLGQGAEFVVCLPRIA
jgi:PAS domain S-box-containing protein